MGCLLCQGHSSEDVKGPHLRAASGWGRLSGPQHPSGWPCGVCVSRRRAPGTERCTPGQAAQVEFRPLICLQVPLVTTMEHPASAESFSVERCREGRGQAEAPLLGGNRLTQTRCDTSHLDGRGGGCTGHLPGARVLPGPTGHTGSERVQSGLGRQAQDLGCMCQFPSRAPTAPGLGKFRSLVGSGPGPGGPRASSGLAAGSPPTLHTHKVSKAS